VHFAEKPLLRGVSHQVAFFAAWVPLYWLLRGARTPLGLRCGLVYAATLLFLLGTSALYHRVPWRPAALKRMYSLDHSATFLLIAGTYTPITLIGVGKSLGAWLCLAIWAGAALGIGQTLFWKSAPRFLHVGIYVGLGWAGSFGLLAETQHLGRGGMLLHLLGGVLYTLGAVTYARKRPDPYPQVFGYHEIFHVFVLVACACLFAVVRLCLALPA
jgi:hemolysin III